MWHSNEDRLNFERLLPETDNWKEVVIGFDCTKSELRVDIVAKANHTHLSDNLRRRGSSLVISAMASQFGRRFEERSKPRMSIEICKDCN